jgi:hypothetical protein
MSPSQAEQFTRPGLRRDTSSVPAWVPHPAIASPSSVGWPRACKLNIAMKPDLANTRSLLISNLVHPGPTGYSDLICVAATMLAFIPSNCTDTRLSLPAAEVFVDGPITKPFEPGEMLTSDRSRRRPQ